MRKVSLALSMSVALVGAAVVSDTASAQIFSGGATFPSKAYRLLYDCWGVPANLGTFPISPSCPNPTGNVSGLGAQILYAPVGSGGGKRAFAHHDDSDSTSTGLGTPGSTNPPYTSALYPNYPVGVGYSGYGHMHFAGSDDVWNTSDNNTYIAQNGGATGGKWGAHIQIPGLIGPVTVPFKGTDGTGAALNIVNPTPTGGSSGLNLSRQAVCGIFSGHITKWDNPILTALNGGTPLGTGQITVVHRSDGSGTSFLFTNGLNAQCAGVFGPNSETDSTLALYSLPWTDRTLAAGQCPAIPVQGSNLLNWPDNLTDQCGTAISNPGGGVFIAGNGNPGVVAAIQSHDGSIGYATPDIVQPVVPGGPPTA
ncbi:MAG TPA: substrate-binding domain-containing protein, partial [Terriglobales bacterium]|nr:substrate-binding domain-containing protein [Terriglobales bacterium]